MIEVSTRVIYVVKEKNIELKLLRSEVQVKVLFRLIK